MVAVEAATTTTATDTPAEAAEPATDAATAAESADQQASDERDESGRYLSREAAGYRRRLRETESERDDLRGRLEGYEREHVERIAGDRGLQVPADIWQFGASLDALRTEDGAIDAEAVSGLVGEIVKDRPGLQARPEGDLGIGRGAAAAGTRIEQPVGLSALLKPEGQRGAICDARRKSRVGRKARQKLLSPTCYTARARTSRRRTRSVRRGIS
jgi:hypothetical protein